MTYTPTMLPLLMLLPSLARASPLRPRIDTPGALYGSSGLPSYEDIAQTTISDCGYAASQAAVAYIDPTWITALITYEGDSTNVSQATFKVYNPNNYTASYEVVTTSELPSNADDKTSVWWSGGLEQATLNVMDAIDYPYGDQMTAAWGLTILTGLTTFTNDSLTQNDYSNSLTEDNLWDYVQLASQTPICIQTLPQSTTLVGNHVYAALNTSMDGDVRQVALYNPWGTAAIWNLSDVYTDMAVLSWIEGFPTGPSGASATSVSSASSSTVAISASSSSTASLSSAAATSSALSGSMSTSATSSTSVAATSSSVIAVVEAVEPSNTSSSIAQASSSATVVSSSAGVSSADAHPSSTGTASASSSGRKTGHCQRSD